MPESDKRLIAQYLHAYGEAFEQIMSQYSERIGGYLSRLAWGHGLTPEDAEDALQETFVAVFYKIGSYDATRRFGPWLYTIATHEIETTGREKGRRGESDQGGDLDLNPGNDPEPLDEALLDESAGDSNRRNVRFFELLRLGLDKIAAHVASQTDMDAFFAAILLESRKLTAATFLETGFALRAYYGSADAVSRTVEQLVPWKSGEDVLCIGHPKEWPGFPSIERVWGELAPKLDDPSLRAEKLTQLICEVLGKLYPTKQVSPDQFCHWKARAIAKLKTPLCQSEQGRLLKEFLSRPKQR
jgi:RNA polymerase sigma factor (sigma-70 family)